MENQTDLSIAFELVEQKKALADLQQQNKTLIESLSKITDRFNGLSKFLIDSNKELTTKIESNGNKLVSPRYTLLPFRSPDTGEIAKAMSVAKSRFEKVSKSATGARNATYATISDMIDVTTDVLAELNLDASFLQGHNEHGESTLTLQVTHASGQWYSITALLNEDLSTQQQYHQKVTAANTTMRRVMYRSMFNLGEE